MRFNLSSLFASAPIPPLVRSFYSSSRSLLSYPRGVTHSLTHSLIISFQCTVRNSLVTRTRTHVKGRAYRPASADPARRSPIIRFHRIFVVQFTWGPPRASGPNANPPINPVSVLALQLSRSVREAHSRDQTDMHAFFPAFEIADRRRNSRCRTTETTCTIFETNCRCAFLNFIPPYQLLAIYTIF